MYNLPHFKEKDLKAVLDFIHKHPFAFVAGCDENNRPAATQVPVFVEEREDGLFLSGHIMKQSDHYKAFAENPGVLCVFTGDHSYVSATWYSNPHQASTWNYMSVHVKGKMRFLDEDALIRVLQKTSLHFEGGDAQSSTVFENLPRAYRQPMLKAIVAFEVSVESIDHVFKLSQNRNKESYEQIIEKLKQKDAGGTAIAEQMEKRKENLFPS